MLDAMSGSSLKLSEKLARDGVQHLSDAELLAIFISSGHGNKSCLQLAYDLLLQVGDLRTILDASLPTFLQVRGLGSVRFLQLQAAREICHRADHISLKKNIHVSFTEALCYLKRKLRDNKNETFVVLFFDSHQRLLGCEEMFHGSIHACHVYFRPLIARALALNASALLIAHNHPNSQCTSSKEDILMTKRLQKALEFVEIRLLDHVIVADNEVFSVIGGRP